MEHSNSEERDQIDWSPVRHEEEPAPEPGAGARSFPVGRLVARVAARIRLGRTDYGRLRPPKLRGRAIRNR